MIKNGQNSKYGQISSEMVKLKMIKLVKNGQMVNMAKMVNNDQK